MNSKSREKRRHIVQADGLDQSTDRIASMTGIDNEIPARLYILASDVETFHVESISQYTAGEFDACVMTNMDALPVEAEELIRPHSSSATSPTATTASC
jgi:hypothetical protein